MWCWGRDVRAPQGNLLLEYGCRKDPTPDPRRAASRYHADLDDGGLLSIWAFGLLYRRADTAIFLRRSDFRPQTAPPATDWDSVWRSTDLPRLTPSVDEAGEQALHQMVSWMAAYESWVLERAGAEWRASVVVAWPDSRKARQLPLVDLAGQWQRLLPLPAGA
jgi:hypothetical protein